MAVSALLLVACAPAAPAGPVDVEVTLTEFAVESSRPSSRSAWPITSL
jgi:hypothetical protein